MLDINPWQAFLSSTSILPKIENYKWIRGTLHARLVFNASPFHYGALAMYYYPFRDDVSGDTSVDLNRVL